MMYNYAAADIRVPGAVWNAGPLDALAFIKYLLRPESNAVWKAKRLQRFN